MSYLVLARKYRPRFFVDVIGQPEVVKQLQGALESKRLGHAFLFCGPRGTGKTSCARILARELNDMKDGTSDLGLDLGSNLDIIEIDGASNRGIDEIRTLRENVKFVPMSGQYKIYIVDEVHMLTTEAFNALLKTLEEPPPHVKFIFATTEPNKVPVTVTSRCQRFSFGRIPLKLIVKHLESICTQEGFIAEEETLYAIAKAAQGSVRDALSVLDQLSATTDKKISVKDVNGIFGLVEIDNLLKLTSALINKNCIEALIILETVIHQGKDIKQLSQDLIESFRHLMILNAGGAELQRMIEYSKAYKKELAAQAALVDMSLILSALDILVSAQDMARVTGSPRLALEVAFAKIIALESSIKKPTESISKPAVAILKNNRGSISLGRSKSTPAPQPEFKVESDLKEVKVEPDAITEEVNAPLIPEPIVSLEDVKTPIQSLNTIHLSLAGVKANWDELTRLVSAKKISVGSNLHEGAPYQLDGGILTIAFCKKNGEFHHSFLNTRENKVLIGDIVSAFLETKVTLNFTLCDNISSLMPDRSESMADTVSMFGGEVVNEWHSEEPMEA